MREKKHQSEFEEKVVKIDRVSRTMRGGRRISFRALVVIGNRQGKIGYAVGKGKEVAQAIEKAKKQARKHLFQIKIVNQTIRKPVTVKFGSARLMLKPAPEGTSIIAGGAVRSVVEIAGIKNIVGKIFGSANKINNTKAALLALKKASR